jgi:hypothetical protein
MQDENGKIVHYSSPNFELLEWTEILENYSEWGP